MADRVDIVQHMRHRPLAEPFVLIQTAEGTAVPGAISGDPDEQAAAFTRRPDRPLFKSLVRVNGWHREF